jgi:hypothetical protein
MALDISTSVIDDEQEVVVRLYKKFTNTTNEAAVNVIDVSGLVGNIDGDACSEVAITKIDAIISGVTVELLNDATANTSLIKMGESGTHDFSYFGGLENDAGAGKTGDVLLTTTGAASGDFFNLVVHGKKVF